MAHSVNFLYIGNHPMHRGDQSIQNSLNGLAMGRHSDIDLIVLFTGDLVGQPAVDTNALA